MAAIRPQSIEELAQVIADAAAEGRKLELRGGGSKAEVGAPREADVLDLTAFFGITGYDPAELVLTAGAGTPLAEIEAAVAERGQMLAFEPSDHGPMFGRPAGAATIGGVVAAGVSGSRRLSRGAARDHLLGFRAVSGRGEAFTGGGKVVKNVTGYDLPKVMAGSLGRLAALTEVTLKVLPRPQTNLSLAIEGLAPGAAVALMSGAMGSKADVAAAAHAPGLTVLRLEGFGPSVEARAALLQSMIPAARRLDQDEAGRFWAGMREPLAGQPVLWRLSVPPNRGSDVVAALGGDWRMDWAGGLVWVAAADAGAVRSAAETAGGHAMLVRAPEAVRARVPTLHPQPAGVAALETRVRRAFDPTGVFETGRF
jgi:glycolate oxidase FAD binding subunit